MLSVEHLATGYGAMQVLFDVSLRVRRGEVLALLGRNGMGKTSTVRAVTGLLPVWAGQVSFAGVPIGGEPAHRIARAGIGLVPEGRHIFPTLSVEENLVATARGGGPWSLACVYALFPALAARRGNAGSRLSGGEQQMLAIARALMTNPRMLILDEATEGLAPLVRAQIWSVLAVLKREGLSILVIDKDVSALQRIADRLVILEKGRTVWDGDAASFAARPALRDEYLHMT